MLVKRVWIDSEPEIGFDPKTDCADVLVEMEDSQLWQAHFVTLAHIQQEMTLSLDVARDHTRALAPRQFVALETPHIIVEELVPDIIEDVVDNLMALGVFESIFNACTSAEEALAAQPETIPPSELKNFQQPPMSA